MFTSQSTELLLQAPCRALRSLKANDDDDSSLWVAGTCDFRDLNHLCLLEYHNDLNELTVRSKHAVDGAVRCLATTTSSNRLVCATGSSATLYELINGEDDIKHIADFVPEGGFGAGIVDLNWRFDSLLTIDGNGHLAKFDVETENCLRELDVDHPMSHVHPPKVQWDPHSAGDAVAVTTNTGVDILDWRADTSIPVGTVDHIPTKYTIDLDYNPNKPHVLGTACADGTAKFWDLRLGRRPILTLRGGHSHWMHSLSYNPFHDQLVLTTGSQASNLWRVSTISSAPLLESRNVRISKHCMEAAYSSAWSASDAWIYGIVSYDGKVSVHHVPSKEKYKILL